MSVNPDDAVLTALARKAALCAPPIDWMLLARLAVRARRNDKTGCFEWRAAHSKAYGLMSHRGKMRLAHRLSWEAHLGPIPQGLFVCHACDNPSCIAIEHLFLGTAKQNVDDMVRKGRARRTMTVLNEPLVAEMKRRFVQGESVRAVAEEFGLAYATTYAVKTGETWKRIPPATGPLAPGSPARLTGVDVMSPVQGNHASAPLSGSTLCTFSSGASDEVG